ncbi:MAG: TonB-dependent receptor [Acidobacteria bacterium]|nr:TonB-dependent receptor [Acidobacteriota bacterium]
MQPVDNRHQHDERESFQQPINVSHLPAWLAVMAVACCPAAWGQTAALLSGRVEASNGQPLPAAAVTARNTETNFSRTAISGETGLYVFPQLPAGPYEVRVSLAGFKPLVRTGIQLTVAQAVAINLVLELGTVEQTITVEAAPPLVNTSTAELSYLVNEGAIAVLPLNGRNYTDLALLQPGVTAYPHRDGGSVVAHGLGMSVNGQDPRSNVYLLDGTPLNDFTNGPAGSAASTALGMETIREFRVETNSYSAEFGRNSGGQINALTKSGSNRLHGSLYYLHRNDNLDARNFFDPGVQPEFRRNQYGGSIGGPVRRNRTFFFAGYEALREGMGRSLSAVVPDANARQGLIPNPAAPGQLLNVGVSAAVRPYLDEYPLPNGGVRGDSLGIHNFLFNQNLRQDFGQLRIDQNFANGSQLFVRYTADDASQYLPTDFPQFPRSFLSRNQFITTEFTHAITPRTLVTARGGFSRTRIGQDVEANTSRPLAPFVAGRRFMGNIDIGGASRFGPQSSVDVKLTQNIYSFEYGVSHVSGRHTLKLGSLFERYQDNMLNPTFSLGTYAFTDLRAFLENRPARYIGLGPTGQYDRYWRFTLFAYYLQDNFQVSRRLTVNLGLRYETTTMPVDLYGRDSAMINLTDPAPVPGRLFRNPGRRNVSPRFGFSWDPAGNGKTAVRGGYGWFFNTNNQQNLIVTVTNPPATPRFIITTGLGFPNPDFARGVGNSIRPVEWNIKNPNVHVWNLNVQREIPGAVLVTLGYAGSRGIHLWRSADVNLPAAQRLADGTVFFPAGAPRLNPRFSTIELKKSDGNSWYNAAVFEIRKRWGKGFNLQSSYTFSRNIDTTQASTFFSDATNGTTSAMPEFPGFQYNKGLADYHAKHNWVTNFAWQLPGRGVMKGWQIAGISNVRSGSPLTVFVQGNRSRSQWNPSLGPGLGQDRVSMAPGYTHQSAVRGGPRQYFDPAAFALPAAGTLGNLGRGALIGPNLRTFDGSLMKDFRWAKLGESGVVQFRAEAFNLFNRANFGVPSLTAFAGARDGELPFSTLGLVRQTVTSSRQIQLGLRVAF